jgi:hypothetical protein
LIAFVATLQIILFDQVDIFRHVINLQASLPAIVWFNNADLFFVSLIVLLLTRPKNWNLRKDSRVGEQTSSHPAPSLSWPGL